MALCLSKEKCMHHCSQHSSCQGIDMSDASPRCFFNDEECLSDESLLGDDESYHFLVKDKLLGSTGIDRRLMHDGKDDGYEGGPIAFDQVLSYGPLDLQSGG